MKTFSIEDLRSIISDIRNSEEKKNLYILLGVFVAVAAIDNMVKGAAGQAIQNMNIIFGLDEKTGLEIVPPAF